MTPEQDDQALLAEFARTRAEGAFEKLVNRHWPRAFRLAHDCLHDAAAAEDVAQEVFLKLARARTAELSLQGAFAPWFRTLVLNAVRDRVKLAERRARHEQRASEQRPTTATDAPGRDLEVEELRRQVALLPLDVRFAVVLRYFEGRTHEDVARILACPPGTASSRIRRGLEQLREQLATVGISASITALEDLLRVAPGPQVPAAPLASALLPRGRSAALAGALALGAALLAGLALLPWLAVDGAPPPQAAATTPPPPAPAAPALDPERPALAPPAAADAAAAAPDPLPPAPLAGPDDEDPARRRAAPAPANAPAGEATADEPPPPGGGGPQPVVVRGRVLASPAMTPLQDVELFLVERYDGAGAHWSGGGEAAARTDAQGEFSLEAEDSGYFINGVQQRRALTDAILLARRPGFRPFLRRLPAAALRDRLELVLDPGAAPAVAGRLVDGDGAPVSGVRIELTLPIQGQASGTLLGAPPVEQSYAVDQPAALEALTGPDGRFRFEALLPAECTVSVQSGQRVTAVARQVRPALEPEEVLLVAAATARLDVEVLDASGAPAPGVDVALAPLARAGTWTQRTGPTDAAGRAAFRVDAGRYRVRVQAGRGRRISEHEEELTLAPGERRKLVVRRPGPAEVGTLVVEVKDAAGAPIQGVEVWVGRADSLDWLDTEQPITDARGRVELPGLRRGRYKVQARQDASGRPQATVNLEGERAQVTIGIERTRTLRGVVEGPDGRPVAGAEVMVYPLNPDGGRTEVTTTDAEGRFSIDGMEEEVHVRVKAAGFSALETAARNDGTQVELVLRAGRTLTVRGEAAVADGTNVEVSWLQEHSMEAQHVEVADRAFEATFVGLGAEDHGTVTVRVGRHVATRHPVAPGQELLTLGPAPLDRGFTVRGRIEDPSGFLAAGGYCGVTAYSPGDEMGDSYDAEVDERSGRFVLEGLPGVPLDLHVNVASPDTSDDRWARAQVRFDPRTQQDLGAVTVSIDAREEPDMNALKVFITDPAGGLAKLGLRDGDVIVGTAGRDFTDMQDLMGTFMRSELEPVSVDVLRGTERVVLRLEKGSLSGAPGGRVEPMKR